MQGSLGKLGKTFRSEKTVCVTNSLIAKTCKNVKLNENELTQQIPLQLFVGSMSMFDRRTFSQIVELNWKFPSPH